MKKRMLFVACLVFSLLVPAISSPAFADEDILLNDFEAADYG
jgi:hypothetical protein